MKLFSIGTNDTKTSLALLLIRIVSGMGIVFNHGLMKLENYGTKVDNFPDPLGVGSQVSLILAIFAEFFCGIFITLGFATRFTVIPLIITMATAFFIIHGSDPFAHRELALIYMTLFLVVFILGPGKYSIDNFFKK